MARRYTITDVTDPGSSVAKFRTAISGSITAGSANKGYSDDTRMRNMFPNSPLYTDSDYTDKQVIGTFKEKSIDIASQSNYDFIGNDKAYLNFNHPQAPSMKMENMNTPITGAGNDNPYHGHANLQVPSLNPKDLRKISSGSDGGLLRARTLQDGGFGTKNELKNYATNEVRNSIGSFFSNVYSSTDVTNQVDSKVNSLGNSTISGSEDSVSAGDLNLSKDVNNFKHI